MRAYALSISPILVIDDNLFEKVYIMNLKHETGYPTMQQMHKHERLKYKTQSTKPNSLKPSKTSPPLALIAKMGEKS